MGDNEKLCATELHLRLKRPESKAGLESETARSVSALPTERPGLPSILVQQ